MTDSLEKHFLQYLESAPLSKSLYNYYLIEESRCVRILIREATPSEEQQEAIHSIASRLVKATRDQGGHGISVESFLKSSAWIRRRASP